MQNLANEGNFPFFFLNIYLNSILCFEYIKKAKSLFGFPMEMGFFFYI